MNYKAENIRIELNFDHKPDKYTCKMLSKHKFNWDSKKKVWFKKTKDFTRNDERFIEQLNY